MTPGHRRHLLSGLAVALLLVLAATGCVNLPESGAVKTERVHQQSGPDAPVDYKPGGPKPGSTTLDIVKGFILAMQATPLNTVVARQFLTAESSSSWVPEKGTVVFGRQLLTTGEDQVTVRLRDTVQLDQRGQWLGDRTDGAGLNYRLRLVREKGEWRISNPPDELLVPQSDFEARFGQYSLYFFDKAARVLVPEPVHLPRGEQLSTLLVAGLLKGPSQDLLGVERTFIPAKTEYEISVPVSRGGTADVPLSDEVLDLSDEDLNRVLAQLAWTLRQVPGVVRMRVTVDGSPLDLPGDGTEPNVYAWPEFSPAVPSSSRALFGVRADRVVAVTGPREEPVTGVLGDGAGIRSIGVDLSGGRVAAVTSDGEQVLAAETGDGAGAPDAVYTGGTDLLRPAWDLSGDLWLLDDTSRGAEVAVLRDGARKVLAVPGVTGKDVVAFALSRDGTRLVAVVAGRSGDRLVLCRILRDHDGRTRRVGRAVPLPLAGAAGDIRDVGWNTPTSIAALVRPARGTSQVLLADVDGSSPLGDVAAVAEDLHAPAVHLVAAPVEGARLYVATARGLVYELASNGRWGSAGIQRGLRAPTFVG